MKWNNLSTLLQQTDMRSKSYEFPNIPNTYVYPFIFSDTMTAKYLAKHFTIKKISKANASKWEISQPLKTLQTMEAHPLLKG